MHSFGLWVEWLVCLPPSSSFVGMFLACSTKAIAAGLPAPSCLLHQSLFHSIYKLGEWTHVLWGQLLSTRHHLPLFRCLFQSVLVPNSVNQSPPLIPTGKQDTNPSSLGFSPQLVWYFKKYLLPCFKSTWGIDSNDHALYFMYFFQNHLFSFPFLWWDEFLLCNTLSFLGDRNA